MGEAQRELIVAARAVLRFWQATCDAHPNRSDWEDHASFYRLSDAVERAENE